MGMQVGSNSTLHKRRIAWLKRNKKYWEGYDANLPGSFAVEKLLLDKMKKVGLYKPNATVLDTSFPNMINKIRTAGRPKKPKKSLIARFSEFRDDDSG